MGGLSLLAWKKRGRVLKTGAKPIQMVLSLSFMEKEVIEVMIVPPVKDMRRPSRIVTLAIRLILVMWLMDTQRPTRWILPRELATTKTPKMHSLPPISPLATNLIRLMHVPPISCHPYACCHQKRVLSRFLLCILPPKGVSPRISSRLRRHPRMLPPKSVFSRVFCCAYCHQKACLLAHPLAFVTTHAYCHQKACPLASFATRTCCSGTNTS